FHLAPAPPNRGRHESGGGDEVTFAPGAGPSATSWRNPLPAAPSRRQSTSPPTPPRSSSHVLPAGSPAEVPGWSGRDVATSTGPSSRPPSHLYYQKLWTLRPAHRYSIFTFTYRRWPARATHTRPTHPGRGGHHVMGLSAVVVPPPRAISSYAPEVGSDQR